MCLCGTRVFLPSEPPVSVTEKLSFNSPALIIIITYFVSSHGALKSLSFATFQENEDKDMNWLKQLLFISPVQLFMKIVLLIDLQN